MGQTEKFSRIVEYKGTYDVSQIIASFNKLKTSLKNRGTSETDILNLDQEVKKVAELDKAIQKAIQRGFKTPKEFSDFTKLTSQASKSIQRLSSDFRRIDADTLSEALKYATNYSKKLQQQTERLSTAYLKNVNSVLKESEHRDEITRKIKENLQNTKNGEVVEHNIKALLSEELALQEESLQRSKDELTVRQNTLQNLEQQKLALQSLTSFNATSGNKNFRSNFLQVGNYTTLSGEAITGTQMADVQSALTEVMSKSDSSIKKLIKTLENYGLKLKNAEDKTTLFNEAARQFKEQLKTSDEAIKNARTSITEQEGAVERLSEAYKKLSNAFGTGENAGKGSLITNYQDIEAAFQRVAAAEAEEIRIRNQQRNPIPGFAENIELQNQFNTALEIGNENTQQAIKAQTELDNTFNQISNRFKYMLSFMNAWHVSMRAIKQTFNDIKNIDKAFASIAMVTDMDISELWEQYDDYAKIANELGQSTESVIKSSALYYQQG